MDRPPHPGRSRVTVAGDGGHSAWRSRPLVRCGWTFLINGVSIEFPGIILGGLGYYFGLQSANRAGQILGIVAVVLSVISILISGLMGGPPRITGEGTQREA